MGSEATATLRVGSRREAGTLLLETDELVFRGASRLRIRRSEIRSVAARDGDLVVEWTGGTATFDLGAKAPAWADRIANPRTLLQKMGFRAEHRVSVLGVRDEGFRADLEKAGVDVSTRLRKESDLIVFSAKEPSDLARIPSLVPALGPKGALWILHPKGRRDFADVHVFAAAKAAGLVDSKVVRFSAEESGLRFTRRKA